MPEGQELTSGVDAVDALLDGVRVGDNLVVVTDGAPGDWVVDAFVDESAAERLVVMDGTGRLTARGVAGHRLTWSDPAVDAVDARRQLVAADRRVGSDARFVVDTLSALAARWGDQAALDLFLWACPRLYRRSSIALWIVDRRCHDEGFLRRLRDVTQVVVLASGAGDRVRLEVRKAAGRPPVVEGRVVEGRLVGGRLVEAGDADPDRPRLGTTLRKLRTRKGMGQAELARRVGISPSALSQAERGVRGVSAETLLRIWDVLGVPFGPEDPAVRGYRVTRRGTHREATLASGVSGHELADGAGRTVWRLTVAARASGRAPLFPVKAAETVTVLEGVLRLEVEGRGEVLHAGDALLADTAAITGWANPADTPADVLWVITGPV